MTTFGDLVNEVQRNLLGFTTDQDQLTLLTSAPTSGATSFTVADATQVSTGLIEVDEELMWCTSISGSTVNVILRGMYGTTAAAHTTSSFVRNNPRFPRFAIMQAINDTLRGSYPDIFGVSSQTITSATATVAYQLDAAAELVLDVKYDTVDTSGYWPKVSRYEVDMQADTTKFPSGKSIAIFDAILQGKSIRVNYRKIPTALSALADDLSTVSGLQDSARPMLVYGACAKMVGYLEPARWSDDTAEARFMDNQQPGAATAAARYFYQQYQMAKAEETRRLLDRYPSRMHFTRR